MTDGIRCMWMRGGTSKGGVFLAEDLPHDPAQRDDLLLRIMGSPDARQIDGMGGGDPLTSKVAVVSKSSRPGIDIDYLFLQVSVDEALVSDTQNCGNMLAAVAPFALERGLLDAQMPETAVTIYMVNTGQVAAARVPTPDGTPRYTGCARIDGVPGTAAAIPLTFENIAGSMCGALLPTGNACDSVDGVRVTLIDNGMPCVIINAADVGASGYESVETLEGASSIKAKVEAIRLQSGLMMGLGDVTDRTVPKMMLVAPPRNGGLITVRSFIPRRVHAAVGVFAAVSVATAALIEGSVAAPVAQRPKGRDITLSVEHPSGEMSCVFTLGAHGDVLKAGVLRTARKLMDGVVFP